VLVCVCVCVPVHLCPYSVHVCVYDILTLHFCSSSRDIHHLGHRVGQSEPHSSQPCTNTNHLIPAAYRKRSLLLWSFARMYALHVLASRNL
jgi:hypothetical protein